MNKWGGGEGALSTEHASVGPGPRRLLNSQVNGSARRENNTAINRNAFRNGKAK